jgi:hypothetical protein
MSFDPEAQVQVDAQMAAKQSGYQQFIRPSRGMRAGLKSLVSLVRSAAAHL